MARRTPMLDPGAVRIAAADNVADAEQRVVDELSLHRYSLADCLSDTASVAESLTAWSSQFDRLLVHVDIDVLDAALFPIAEHTCTLAGLTLPVSVRLLDGLCHSPNFAALTLCEVSPEHARDEQAQLGALIEMLATVLGPRDERAPRLRDSALPPR